MKHRPKTAVVRRIAAIAILGFLVACEFEEDLVPVDWQMGDERRFGNVTTRPVNPAEATQADVDRLINELYDPYNIPGETPYRGSIYEQMDMIIKGAYDYYDIDLQREAILQNDNPITEQMFLEYLEAENLTLIEDPVSGELVQVYAWLETGAINAHGGVYFDVLDRADFDPTHFMNYERNYLATIFSLYIYDVMESRKQFRADLADWHGDDAATVYEYLETVDSFGPE